MPKRKTNNNDKPKSNDNNGTNDESKSNKTKAKPKPQTVFVGFYRNEGSDRYALHPQMLSSEDSMTRKIKLMYGDVDMHIFATELPA